MSKTYEVLAREASEEEFENLAVQTTEIQKQRARQEHKVDRITKLRPVSIHSGNKYCRKNNSEDMITSLGEWEDLANKPIYDDIYVKERQREKDLNNEMWSEIICKFGEPLTFIGNPFDRALNAQKELLQCAKEIQGLVKALNLDEQKISELEVVHKSPASKN